MARNDVTIRFRADTKDAERGMERLSGRSKALDVDVKKLAIGVAAGGAAFAGIAMASKALVDKFNEQERAERVLAQVVNNTGTAYEDVEQQILRTTSALQAKTNFGDEEQIRALARMTVILGDVEKAQAALPAVLDAASASGRDLGTVSETLTKALAGQANTAESLGIKFDEAAGFAERLEEVQNRVGGAAEENADPFVQLGNAMEDFQEVLGGLLAGPLTAAVKGMTTLVSGVSGLVDALIIANDMFEENGQNANFASEEWIQFKALQEGNADAIAKSQARMDEMNASLQETLHPMEVLLDDTGDWILAMGEQGVAQERARQAMNNYGITADQVAAISRRNFDAQKQLNDLLEDSAAQEAAQRATDAAADAQRRYNTALESGRLAAEKAQDAFEDYMETVRQNTKEANDFWATWRNGRKVAEESMTQWGELGITMADVNRILVEQGLHTDNLGWEMRKAGVDISDVGDVLEFLAEQGVDVTKMFQDQIKAINEETAALRRMEEQTRAAQAAQLELVGKFAGNGPANIAVQRRDLAEQGAAIFQRMSEFTRQELGVSTEDELIDLMVRRAEQMRQGGTDRRAAEMSVIRRFEDMAGFAEGGVALRGGLAMVGERGPELVSLPTGATVFPTGTGPGGVTVVNNFAGATIIGDEDLDFRIKRATRAAVREATGGRRR